MRRLILMFIPGDESWMWRRVSLLGSVVTLLYCVVTANAKGDSATVAQDIIGLLGVLGIYTSAAVTDDHLKRQSEKT